MYTLDVFRVVALLLAAISLSPRAQSPGTQPFQPWIDSRAAGLFSPPFSPDRVHVRYQADAQILLPLLITSVGLAWKRDVGFATIAYDERLSPEGRSLRSFEFFGTSVPERARGVDRMGFFREVLGGGGAEWCAYLGAMTASPEQSLEQARRTAAEKRQVQGFEIVNGLFKGKQSQSDLFRLTASMRSTTASELYETLRPLLDRARPVTTRTVPIAGADVRPLSFLSGVAASLGRAAGAAGGDRRTLRQLFVYHGRLRSLDVVGIEPDPEGGQLFQVRGLVTRADSVRRVDYRIMEGSDEQATFRVWIDTSAGAPRNSVPLFPLAFEYQPRSFLKLRFERQAM
jgi:hypothetical protein